MKSLLAYLLAFVAITGIASYTFLESRSLLSERDRLLAQAETWDPGSTTRHENITEQRAADLQPSAPPLLIITVDATTTPWRDERPPSPGTSTPSLPPIRPLDSAPRDLKPEDQKPPAPSPAASSTPAAELQSTAASIRNLQQEVRSVETTVRDTVLRDAAAARTTAAQSAPDGPAAFDESERMRRLEAIADRLGIDVQTVIAGGDASPESLSRLTPVLKSSLEEIRLLIREETGVDVDLSPSARAVTDVVAERTPVLEEARQEVLKRKGLELYKDTDEDGISDYDEKRIYGTDPENASTAGGLLTDGERILLGFDPFSTSTERVPVESPRAAGEVALNLFEVDTIRVDVTPIEGTTTPEGVPPPVKQSMTFGGRGLPNGFVTLYVFSTPVVVTVKADSTGAWSYTLDSELPDGEHELYVATVDAGGRILAKSPAVPFTKTAQAAEFAPLLIAAADEPSLADFFLEYLWLVGIVAFLLFGIIALIILGLRRGGPEDEGRVAA